MKKILLKPNKRRHIAVVLLLMITFTLGACKSDSVNNDITNGTDSSEGIKMTDYDGNVYETVQIGDQIWMAENLRVTHYNDGSALLYFSVNGDSANDAEFGLLYDFVTVNKTNKTIAPEGWHVPTKADWKILIETLGGMDEAGKKMKSLNYWAEGTADSESLFKARPAGMNDFTNIFQWFETSACFSTASNGSGSDALYYFVKSEGDELIEGNFHPNDAVSVRLIKDQN